MKLGEIVSPLPVREIKGNAEVEVTGLAYHSRNVAEGFLFAAVRGAREDGRKYIPEALSRGASSLLVDAPLNLSTAAQVIVPEVREALARLAAAFYQEPSSQLALVGITGTNGKTTTSYLIESILKEDGQRVGVVGTVNYRFGERIFPAPTTTPESLDLQRMLWEMKEAGVTYAVLEVSSHALTMQRVRGCHFDVALFTNLTRDHLDYHGTMENYFDAKKLLFTRVLEESRKTPRFAIINADDPWGGKFAREARGTVLSYGIDRQREVWPENVRQGTEGLRVRLRTPRGLLDVASPLLGRHNLYNILAAAAFGEALELPQGCMAAGIARLARVPGRLERVPGGDGVRVYVDYAHTGDALERALQALQEVRSGRMIVVFGCGGDRDRGKRPVMGKMAGLGSDLAVITSDNPRGEDPLAIIAAVEEGMRQAGRGRLELSASHPAGPGYWVVPDRREAIRLAIGAARPGDVVLIAGKGHEDYQIIGGQRIHFDDREEAAEALADLKAHDRRADMLGGMWKS